MPKVKEIHAREILDSRGNPTVEVDVTLDDGAFGRASVPSGVSTGIHEALELRDGDMSRYNGLGVQKAIRNVNRIIADEMIGMDIEKLKLMDLKMINLDGTPNKAKLGANAILGVSMSLMKAKAESKKISLYQFVRMVFDLGVRDIKKEAYIMPVPLINVVNGGKHADNNIDIQEMMIVPVGFETFKEALRASSETFHELKRILKEKGLSTGVGDEGGFAPDLKTNEEGIDLIILAITRAGYSPGKEFFIALDPAASSFYKEGRYVFKNGEERDSEAMISLYSSWIKKYPIISIEDGLAEDDWDGWKKMTESLKHSVQLVGDDLFATNVERLSDGIKRGVANSILIKLNQIGTVTQALDAINLAEENGYTAIVSHRSGETEDTTIADLAVGTSIGQIKTGSLSRSERLAKYNQLLRIEEELGSRAKYLGKKAFKFLG